MPFIKQKVCGVTYKKQPISSVVKILFNTWMDRLNVLRGIMNNEFDFKFDKGVITIRDPRDELISRLLYWISPYVEHQNYDENKLNEWIDCIRKKEENPQQYSFFSMLRDVNRIFNDIDLLSPQKYLLKRYYKFISIQPEHNYIIRYEDFITNKLEGLENHLGIPLSSNRDVGDDLLKTKRTATFNNWKSFFTQEDISRFFKYFGDEMEMMGYTDKELTPTDRLDPTVCSQYVERIVASAKIVRKRLLSEKKKAFKL
jgi:hypothetical protein